MAEGSERFIVVGKVGAPHGIKGEVKITSFTEKADDISEYLSWFLKKEGRWVETRVEKIVSQGKYLVAKLLHCNDRDNAQQWTNCEIAVKREQLPELPEGQYYWSDLEGLEVKTPLGLGLGKVKEIIETGANPVIVVVGEKRHLVPYLPQVVNEVNLSAGYIIVDWDAGF